MKIKEKDFENKKKANELKIKAEELRLSDITAKLARQREELASVAQRKEAVKQVQTAINSNRRSHSDHYRVDSTRFGLTKSAPVSPLKSPNHIGSDSKHSPELKRPETKATAQEKLNDSTLSRADDSFS